MVLLNSNRATTKGDQMRRATYQSRIGLRLQTGLLELLGEASDRANQSPAAYARQAIMERLQRDGLPIDLGKPQDRSTTLKAA
jgi:hypothetical protein